MAERDLFLAALIKKGLDGLNKKVDTLAAVAGEEASWASIKKVVAAGMAPNAYPIGTQFSVSHTKYGNLLFDVVAHNHHKNPNNAAAPTMTLLLHNIIYSRPFDGAEAVYCVTEENYPEGLPAGTYHFLPPSDYLTNAELEGWTGIQFTTTQVVPAGGQIVIVGWESGNISAKKISTFESNAAMTAIESGLTLSDGKGGTSIGTIHKYNEDADGYMNVLQRLRYGNSNWNESNIRQWLNSDAASGWWTPTHSLDRLSSTYANLEGFLNGINPEFAAVLGEVDVATQKNNAFENDNQRGDIVYTTRDKVFLLSNNEVGYNVEGIAQGSVVDFYDGAANADRIKYDYASTATARGWWLRSPVPGIAGNARVVDTTGARSNSYAYFGYGAAAACVIY